MKLGMLVGLGPGHTVLDGDSAPLPKGEEPSAPPPQRGRAPNFRQICCGQMAAWIKMPLGMEVGLGPGNCVRWDPTPSPKRGWSPQIFGPCLLWPNGWMDQDSTSHGGRSQPRLLCVRWRPSPLPKKRAKMETSSLPKKGAEPPPQFSAHFYCDQTAECIKMPLGMEVGLSPGDFVLDGDPASSPKSGVEPIPIFGLCVLLPNGCMDQDATWYGGRPRPRQHCVRWGPSSFLPKRGQSPASQFSAHDN